MVLLGGTRPKNDEIENSGLVQSSDFENSQKLQMHSKICNTVLQFMAVVYTTVVYTLVYNFWMLDHSSTIYTAAHSILFENMDDDQENVSLWNDFTYQHEEAELRAWKRLLLVVED